MSSYQPYPIFDMSTGLVLAREPWLIPQDAFRTLNDCYLYHGVLQKRHGYSEFAQVVHVDGCAFGEGLFGAGRFGIGRVVTNPANAVMGIYNYYKESLEKLLIMDTERVNKYNTSSQQCDDLTVLKIRFKSGQTEILVGDTITGATSSDTAIVVAVVLDNGAWADSDASGTLIVSSASVGDFTANESITIHGSTVAAVPSSVSKEEFTGTDVDFFWFENWKDVGYLTNNQDQIQKFDGSYFTKLNIDLDVEGGPDNDVNTCLLIFIIKSRIVLFRITERGIACNQRARWCEVNDPGTWKDDNYLDAPTDEFIMAADFIGNTLIFWFERSIWKFSYTGDADLPFRWEKVVATEGCYATMSLSAFSDEIIGIGPTRILATDGRDVYGIDDKIPDLMLTWNQNALDYCYSLVLEETRQVYLSYSSQGVSKPDKVLAFNYEENNFAIFDLPVHVMGYSTLETDIVLDEMGDIVLDDIAYSFDDRELQAGYPTTLMGCRDGYIYQLNDTDADNGENIEFEAVSGRWNPHVKEGAQARLGWIDFLVDRNGASFTIYFYINSEPSSYKNQLVTCDKTGSTEEKIWVRAECGAVGSTHSIRMTNNATGNRPRIHATVPYFKRAGGRLLTN